MRTRSFISASIGAIALAATMTTLSADQSTSRDRESVTSQSQQTPKPAAPSTQFAVLKGVKAAPMKPAELNEVKGQHIHFFVNFEGHPSGTPFLVNKNNENTYGLGQAPDGSGAGYSGLCNASALGTSAIFIPVGEGC